MTTKSIIKSAARDAGQIEARFAPVGATVEQDGIRYRVELREGSGHAGDVRPLGVPAGCDITNIHWRRSPTCSGFALRRRDGVPAEPVVKANVRYAD